MEPDTQPEFRLGEGRISGVFSIVLGSLGLAAVFCLLFPSLLTTPDMRAIYPMPAVRALIQFVLATAFIHEGGPTLRTSESAATEQASVQRETPEVPVTEPTAAASAVGPAPAIQDRAGLARLLTWRNALGAGVLVFAIWGAIAASWMLMTVPGLVVKAEAADFFDAEGRVVVAEFENETDQPALALAIRQAIITDLHQSEYVNVVESFEMDEVLERMRLADTTHLDADVAVEVARRQGYPAVVAGEVATLGTGYQLTARIIEAATGEVAVRLRETAADGSEVIPAVERLARLARRHLGESLTSLQSSQPLPSVTTSSLEALELYARAGAHANRGDFESAIPLAQQAVEVDTAFAAAYRALAIWLSNSGNPVAAQPNIDRAYRFAERLLPRERYFTAASYHSYRGRFDSAAHYHGLVLDRSPNHRGAVNNLGDLYERMARYEDALGLYRRSVEIGPSSTGYLNVASAARTLGKHELADSALASMLESYPGVWHTWSTQLSNAYYAGDFERAEQIATDMAMHQDPWPRSFGRYSLASLRAMHGQVGASLALADTSVEFAREFGSVTTEYNILRLVTYAALAAGTPERAQTLLAEVTDPTSLQAPPIRQHLALGFIGAGHAVMGDLAEARRILASMDSLVNASDFHPLGPGEHLRALIALSEDRPEASLEHIRQARAKAFGLLHHGTRLLLADTYAALGRLEEAAAQYDTLTSTYGLSFYDTADYGPIRPIAHERLGSIYLTLGDTTAAIKNLAAFAELWRDADVELQPRVESAERLLSQLAGERN